MSLRYTGELAALLTAFLWTVSALSFSSAALRVGSLSVNLIRLAIAWVLLSAHGLVFRGHPFPTDASGEAWLWLTISGLVGFFLGDLCLMKALLLIGPRLTMLLMSLAPPLAAMAGYLVLGERLEALSWLGMAVTLAGVSWVVLERKAPENGRVRAAGAAGIILGALAALGQAVGAVLSKYGMGGYDPFAATQIRALAGLVCFAVLLLFLRWYPRVAAALRDPRATGQIALGAIVGPYLGVSLFLLSLKSIDTGVAQTLVSIIPVLIIPFVILLYKERVSLRAAAGAAVAVAGVSILTLAPKAGGERVSLKSETAILREGGPPATLHIVWRDLPLIRHPAILMPGSLEAGSPPEWSSGLLHEGYMLVAFKADDPPDPDPARRPEWLIFDERFAHSYALGARRAVRDAARVIDYLISRGDVDPAKIGWIGSSSTGIPGLAVAAEEPRLAALVAFVSTGAYREWFATWQENGLWRGKRSELWPETEELLREDPILHADRLFPKAILLVSGGKDKVVDPRTARSFVEKAMPFYSSDPERLRLVIYDNFGHNLPLDAVKMHAENWFRTYMHPARPPPAPRGEPRDLGESARRTRIDAADPDAPVTGLK